MGRLRPPDKQTESHENCPPLKTWREKMAVYPYTLRDDVTYEIIFPYP